MEELDGTDLNIGRSDRSESVDRRPASADGRRRGARRDHGRNGVHRRYCFGRRTAGPAPISFPYWVAASGITLLGCGLTAWLLRLWRPMRSYLFLAASMTTLLSPLLVFAVSDLGTAVRIWRGSVVFGEFPGLTLCLKVLVPMSLFAGVLTAARNRVMRPPPHRALQ
jgi:hypothetical protein